MTAMPASHPTITADSTLRDIVYALRHQRPDLMVVFVEAKVADVLQLEVHTQDGTPVSDVIRHGVAHRLTERLAYRIYQLSTGAGQPPMFLISQNGFALGYRRGRFRLATEEELNALDPAPPLPALKTMAKALDVSSRMTITRPAPVHDPTGATVTVAPAQPDEDVHPEQPGRQVQATSEVFWQRLVQHHRAMPSFYAECIEPTPLETEILAHVGHETWNEMLAFAVGCNHMPDEALLALYKSSLVTVGDDIPISLTNLAVIDTLRDVERTAPHSLVVGPTKCGKSAMATAVNDITNLGGKYDKATSAGVVGFISTDKARKGSLNESTGLATFDEVTSYQKYDIFSQLFSLMETGHESITQAGAAQSTRTLCTMSFVSNAVMGEAIASFNKTMEYISTNAEGFGSRLGWIAFNQYITSKVMYPEFTQDDVRSVQHLVRQMLLRTRSKVNDAFNYLLCMDWFQGPPTDYISHVKGKIAAEWAGDSQCFKLWDAHVSENNKHVFGAAFRLWAAERLLDIDRTETGVPLLELAMSAMDSRAPAPLSLSRRVHTVQYINRKSLAYMLHVVDEATPAELAKQLENMPTIDRVVVSACGAYQCDHATAGAVADVPLQVMLESVAGALVEDGVLSEDSLYARPSFVRSHITPRARRRLELEWGIMMHPNTGNVTVQGHKPGETWNAAHLPPTPAAPAHEGGV